MFPLTSSEISQIYTCFLVESRTTRISVIILCLGESVWGFCLFSPLPPDTCQQQPSRLWCRVSKWWPPSKRPTGSQEVEVVTLGEDCREWINHHLAVYRHKIEDHVHLYTVTCSKRIIHSLTLSKENNVLWLKGLFPAKLI